MRRRLHLPPNTDGATDRPRAVFFAIVGIIGYLWGWSMGLVEAAL